MLKDKRKLLYVVAFVVLLLILILVVVLVVNQNSKNRILLLIMSPVLVVALAHKSNPRSSSDVFPLILERAQAYSEDALVQFYTGVTPHIKDTTTYYGTEDGLFSHWFASVYSPPNQKR
jgi:c-di-AMP phosphodiesterase-like protein